MNTQDIKNKLRQVNWSPIIKTIVIIALIGLIIFLLLKVRDKNETIAQFKDAVSGKEYQMSQLKTTIGNLSGQVQQTQANKEVIQAVKKKLIDSLSKILKVKPNSIQGITTVSTETKGDYKAPIVEDKSDDIDTTKKHYGFKYSDGYLSFDGKFTSDKDTVSGDYNYKDTLAFAKRVEGNKVFINAFSKNKKTNITGMTSFDIAPAKKTGIGWKIVAIVSSGLLVYKFVK